MLLINVIPEERKALVQYPEASRMPSKAITVFSWDNVQVRWEKETRKYVYDTLRKWIIQRNHAYKSVGQLSIERAHAVDKLLLMLVNYQYAPLYSLCRKVVEHYELLVLLLPTETCRTNQHAKEIIAPMLIWCCEFKNEKITTK